MLGVFPPFGLPIVHGGQPITTSANLAFRLSANFDFWPNWPEQFRKLHRGGRGEGWRAEEGGKPTPKFRSITLPLWEVSGVFLVEFLEVFLKRRGRQRDRTIASRVCCSSQVGERGKSDPRHLAALRKTMKKSAKCRSSQRCEGRSKLVSLPKIFQYVGSSTKLTMIVPVRCAENAQTPSAQEARKRARNDTVAPSQC